MSNIPEWAKELVTQVCEDYKRTEPKVHWTQGSSEYGSGHWKAKGTHYTRLKNGTYKRLKNKAYIHISAGTDKFCQEIVLLHELAHHINGRNKRRGHDKRFWQLAFELYQRYGLELDRAYKNEIVRTSQYNQRRTAELVYNSIKEQ